MGLDLMPAKPQSFRRNTKILKKALPVHVLLLEAVRIGLTQSGFFCSTVLLEHTACAQKLSQTL